MATRNSFVGIVDVERKADLIDIKPRRSLDIAHRQRNHLDREILDCFAGRVHRTHASSFGPISAAPIVHLRPEFPEATVTFLQANPGQISQINNDITNWL